MKARRKSDDNMLHVSHNADVDYTLEQLFCPVRSSHVSFTPYELHFSNLTGSEVGMHR
jgi:hypothetical protein